MLSAVQHLLVAHDASNALFGALALLVSALATENEETTASLTRVLLALPFGHIWLLYEKWELFCRIYRNPTSANHITILDLVSQVWCAIFWV